MNKRKYSFLVIEGQPLFRKQIASMLDSLGQGKVEQAKSAHQAWLGIKDGLYDVILSAWEMPEMTGLALLRLVRSTPKLAKMPFFLIDTSMTKVKVIQAGQAGVTDLIVIPFQKKTLRDKIDRLSSSVLDKRIAKSEKMLERGLDEMKCGNFEAALEIFTEVINSSESPEVYYNIGYIRTNQKLYTEALEAFRKATQLDGLFAKAYEAMGRVFNILGRDKEAQKQLQHAADIYLEQENVDNAEAVLNDIVKINPKTTNVYNTLGVLNRRKGEYNKAIRNYEKALKIHPQEPNIYYNIGRVYIDLKQFDNASNALKTALQIRPKFKEAADVLKAIEFGKISVK